MKNTILMVLALVLFSSPSFAQNNYNGSVKESVVMTLMDYGVQLYNRGDYREAQAVFNRVLAYDPNQPVARRYLNQIDPPPVEVKAKAKVQESRHLASHHVEEDPAIADLRQRIDAKEGQINQLKTEIDQLRSPIN